MHAGGIVRRRWRCRRRLRRRRRRGRRWGAHVRVHDALAAHVEALLAARVRSLAPEKVPRAVR